jgi:transcriptional regulator with XRE-family HTH domain
MKHAMVPTAAQNQRPESLAERVKRLREAKQLGQNELAERAELAPAALSRILNGERTPRMEHLLALAQALEITVTELVAGSDSQDVVGAWISRERFEASERARVDAQREFEVARAELSAKAVEIDALKKTNAEHTAKVQQLERDLAYARADRDEAQRLRAELASARRDLGAISAERDRLRASSNELEQRIRSASLTSAMYQRSYDEACARIAQLQQDLENQHGGQVAAGVIGAGLGAILTAIATTGTASPRTTSRIASSRRGRRGR